MTAQQANISLERFLCTIRCYTGLRCNKQLQYVQTDQELSILPLPACSQKLHKCVALPQCVFLPECLCVCTCINNCVRVSVPSIKHFIGFLSELLQVVPLFKTRLWAAHRGHEGVQHTLYLTSTLNPSRPCYAEEREGCSPGSDMAQEGSQARVRRGGDSVINEPVRSIGSITVHWARKTVFKLKWKAGTG